MARRKKKSPRRWGKSIARFREDAGKLAISALKKRYNRSEAAVRLQASKLGLSLRVQPESRKKRTKRALKKN